MVAARRSSSTPKTSCDVIVAGAGVAGATAGGLLARDGRAVAVLDLGTTVAAPESEVWISGAAAATNDLLAFPWQKHAGVPVDTVAFHTADFRKTQEVRFDDPVGWCASLPEWSREVLRAASRLGAVIVEAGNADFCAHDDRVEATIGGRLIRTASLLLLASAPESGRVQGLGWSPGAPATSGYASHFVGTAPDRCRLREGTLHFVLGLEGGRGIGLLWRRSDRYALTAVAPTETASLVQIDFLARACASRFDLPAPPVRLPSAEVVVHPTARALDIDSHVGKRSLVFGEAGGFVGAAAAERVYPQMWSARLAAQVVHRALDGVHPQDVLRDFDTAWRTEMADYLRPPNTDLPYLLSIVFANKPMAARLARAFLNGGGL